MKKKKKEKQYTTKFKTPDAYIPKLKDVSLFGLYQVGIIVMTIFSWLVAGRLPSDSLDSV